MNDDVQFKLGELTQCATDMGKRLCSLEKKVDIGFSNINKKVEELKFWKVRTVGFASGIGTVIGLIWVMIERVWR